MRLRLKTAAAVVLAVSFVFAYAQAGAPAPQTKKHTAAKKAKTPPAPSVEEQIQALRSELQTQINSLKNDLTAKDAELKKAQQDASDARATAAKADAAAAAQQQAASDNAAAVSTLQSTVKDLTTNQVSLATTVSDETTSLKKTIASPDAIQYKGITISPAGSFVAAETVWRSAATAGDINTALTGVPLQNSEAYQMSEFQGSGRQSRIALKAVGKLNNVTMTGYYEADWLSSGTTSNNNQSSSYTMRQRQLWAGAKLANGWDFSGGQGWSLTAETTKGLERGSEALPSTIDAQYTAGFVWTRQYGFRVTKNIGKSVFVGASVENAETLNPGGANLPTNILIGSGGTGGGLYNSGANYSFNYTPDFVVKAAIEPGWGHWEVFGIERNFHDRIYPASGTAYNDTRIGAGIGGGFRAPLANKKVTLAMKGLWGQGVGRYGDSTIADITLRPNGTISPIHGFSALSTLEVNPTPRLSLYFNYGADYLNRDYVLNGTTQVGYGTRSADMSGCGIEPASTSANPSSDPATPGNATNGCKGNNKDVQEFSTGYWFNFYNGPKGRLRQGIQYGYIRRDLWSGNGGTLNPGGGAYGADNMIFTSFRYYLP